VFEDYLIALPSLAIPQHLIIFRIMSPNTTAVVLIEYQNDFTTPGGKLHDAVKPVMESTKMLENTVEMVREARKAGATIVYVPIQFAPGFNELSRDPYGILKGCKEGQVFEKGSWGAEIVEVLKPQAGDIVVEGKRGLDGFATTNLDFILRSRKIDTIALSGFLTNCCVESTMRTGYELGYNVITVKDCAATVSEEAQSGAIEHDFPMFSHPMTHNEFVSALTEREPQSVSA
jgi:nicotinamidase-related amidase